MSGSTFGSTFARRRWATQKPRRTKQRRRRQLGLFGLLDLAAPLRAMGLRRAAIVVCACVAARARASPLFADGLDGGDPLAPEFDELDELVGGDADVYGCRASAGYAWCASRGACVRAWETPCPVEFAEEDSHSKENDSKEGEAEEEEEETRDEDEEAERAIKLNIIVLTVSVLVAIAQAFEFGPRPAPESKPSRCAGLGAGSSAERVYRAARRARVPGGVACPCGVGSEDSRHQSSNVAGNARGTTNGGLGSGVERRERVRYNFSGVFE